MRKNASVLLLFVFITGVLALSFRVIVTSHAFRLNNSGKAGMTNSYQMYVSLPYSLTGYSSEVETRDARTIIIENFFRNHNSPLYPYAKHMVAAADRYNLDFRLLPAIAMKESSAGKYFPMDSHNAWGYGIWGDNVLKFKDWEEGINTVASGLSDNYVKQGLVTPQQIMTKYTPPSLEKGGPWARDVEAFMKEME